MRKKQDELEVLVSCQSYNATSISEFWWNESHDWSAGMERYRLLRRDIQSRKGGYVTLYVRQKFEFRALMVNDDVFESLWVRIRRIENERDVVVDVYYLSPSQDISTDYQFHRHQGEISGLVALVPIRDFSFLDINWEYHTVVISRSWKLLKFVGDNFLSQVVSEPTRKGALLDLLFVNREELMEDVMARGCLGHSDCEMLEFKIFSVMRKKAQQICYPGLQTKF